MIASSNRNVGSKLDDYFDRLDPVHLERRSVRQLERLGYAVILTPLAGAS